VTVVSDGVLSLPGAMLGHNADPAVRAAWLEDNFLPPDVAVGATWSRCGSAAASSSTNRPARGSCLPRAEPGAMEAAAVPHQTTLRPPSIWTTLAGYRRRVRDRLRPDLRVHLAAAEAEFWASPALSRVSMPPGFPDALRRAAKRFLNEYRSQLRTFEAEYEVAPGVLVRRTGGHTPGTAVRLASGSDLLTFAGDAVRGRVRTPRLVQRLQHDPEEAARVRVGLLRELAANRELLVATTCRFRPSAMWRSPATCFVGYRPSGTTDRLLG
jgi:hypothetical protein